MTYCIISELYIKKSVFYTVTIRRRRRRRRKWVFWKIN